MSAGPRLRGLRYIAPDNLENEAQRFLQEFHPSLAVPVPIEAIVEFRLGLEVIPVPNLWRGFEVDGFLALDGGRIFVDEWQMEHMETRYRFTLAHEIGHWILHRDLYADADVVDLDSYLNAYEAMSDEDQDHWEFQARNLGGRILLPKVPFLAAAEEAFRPFRDKIPKGSDTKLVCGRLAKLVASRFHVHEKVAETRLFGDGLCEEIGLHRQSSP